MASEFGYLIEILWFVCLFSIVSLSLNFVIGYTGLFNLGQVGFMATGALGTTIVTMINRNLVRTMGVDLGLWVVPLGIILGVLFSLCAAVFIGIPALRLRGDYFAIATLGFAEIIRVMLNSVEEFSGTPEHVSSIFKGEFRGQLELLLVFIILVVSFLILRKLSRSPFGRVLRAIRDDEDAASAVGKDPMTFKLRAFMIGALFASIVGSLYVHHFMVFVPNNYSIMLTIFILVMVVLGGLGSNIGVIAGTVVIAIVNEAPKFMGLPTEFIGPANLLIFSIMIIVIMLFRPSGLLSEKELKALRKLFEGEKKPEEEKGQEKDRMGGDEGNGHAGEERTGKEIRREQGRETKRKRRTEEKDMS